MLTDTKARKLKPGEKPIAVGGVTGLYLHAGSRPGNGKYLLRFTSPVSTKHRDMGLGTYPEICLAEARKNASSARELIARGVDPIEHRRQAATGSEQTVLTFEEASRIVFEKLAPGFRNQKHRAQWISTLESLVFKTIGHKKVDALTAADFAEALQSIWLAKQETASRVKQRCERVMTWCVASQIVQTKPVSAVDALLPRQRRRRDRVVHHPAAPWRSMPGIVASLMSPSTLSVSRQALVFLILTAVRSGEVRGATRHEIDLEGGTWTIPADRMKAAKQHRVPLSRQAKELLDARARTPLGGEWLFSVYGTRRMSDMTLTKVLRAEAFPSDVVDRSATAHEFRSSFRDWASENGYPRYLAEGALAHRIANETEAAYHRTDRLDQRRFMLQDWADYLIDGSSPRSTRASAPRI